MSLEEEAEEGGEGKREAVVMMVVVRHRPRPARFVARCRATARGGIRTSLLRKRPHAP